MTLINHMDAESSIHATPVTESATTAQPAWSLALQGPEYRWALPILSSLPTSTAYKLALWRGQFNTRHDRDWVSLGLRHRHVAAQTASGLAEWLAPEQIDALVIERFETVSREEMECRALDRFGLQWFDIDANAALERLTQRPRGRGVVLLTAHLETFVLGIAALAQCGEVIHPVMSRVSADSRLHPAVRNHFIRKYAGLQRHLNGGTLANAEDSMRHFYRALARDEAVVVLCDAPAPSGSRQLCVPWVDGRRAMAQGAMRMAQACGSAVGAFACEWRGGRRHAVHLSPLMELPALGLDQCAVHAYEFLARHIRNRPGRWWASHLLPACTPCHATTEGAGCTGL